MTPEYQQKIDETYEWMLQKKRQQITQPLDDPSRNIIGGLSSEGSGSTTKTQTIAISGGPENIIVPAAYTGTVIILAKGTRYEIPYIATV